MVEFTAKIPLANVYVNMKNQTILQHLAQNPKEQLIVLPHDYLPSKKLDQVIAWIKIGCKIFAVIPSLIKDFHRVSAALGVPSTDMAVRDIKQRQAKLAINIKTMELLISYERKPFFRFENKSAPYIACRYNGSIRPFELSKEQMPTSPYGPSRYWPAIKHLVHADIDIKPLIKLSRALYTEEVLSKVELLDSMRVHKADYAVIGEEIYLPVLPNLGRVEKCTKPGKKDLSVMFPCPLDKSAEEEFAWRCQTVGNIVFLYIPPERI